MSNTPSLDVEKLSNLNALLDESKKKEIKDKATTFIALLDQAGMPLLQKRAFGELYMNYLLDRYNFMQVYKSLQSKITSEGIEAHKEYGVILSKYGELLIKNNSVFNTMIERIQKEFERISGAVESIDLNSFLNDEANLSSEKFLAKKGKSYSSSVQ